MPQGLPARRSLSQDQLEDIQRCLIGVINSSEELIVSSMILAFTRCEKYLRQNRGIFIGKTLGSKAEREILQAAGIDTSKSMKFLNLGELLNIYSHVLKRSGTPAPKNLKSGWQDGARLRNQAAHGEAEFLAEWPTLLAIFTDFLVRFSKLADIIKGVLEGTCNVNEQ